MSQLTTVPKTILDKNGRKTTVYVSAEKPHTSVLGRIFGNKKSRNRDVSTLSKSGSEPKLSPAGQPQISGYSIERDKATADIKIYLDGNHVITAALENDDRVFIDATTGTRHRSVAIDNMEDTISSQLELTTDSFLTSMETINEAFRHSIIAKIPYAAAVAMLPKERVTPLVSNPQGADSK